MYYPNKLRSNTKFIPLIPGIIMITLFAFAVIFIDISAGLFVMFLSFGLFPLFSFFLFLRTHNNSFLAGSLMQLLFAIYFATVPKGFIRRNLIALPYLEDDRVVFFPIRIGDEYLVVTLANFLSGSWDTIKKVNLNGLSIS